MYFNRCILKSDRRATVVQMEKNKCTFKQVTLKKLKEKEVQ